MGIFRRVHKLVSADIHGMLDLMEDPVDCCKQAIREMEEEIAAQKQSIKEREDTLRHLEEQCKRIAMRHKEAEEALKVCMASNDEGLMRQVIKKKLEQEKLLRVLAEQRNTITAQHARETKQLIEFQERLTAVREKLACFSEREALNQNNPLTSDFNEPLHVSEEEVTVALLSFKQSQSTGVQ